MVQHVQHVQHTRSIAIAMVTTERAPALGFSAQQTVHIPSCTYHRAHTIVHMLLEQHQRGRKQTLQNARPVPQNLCHALLLH
jgi:glutaredoxin-related protein